MYRCKICGKKYTELTALYNHIESKHKEMIPKDMTVQQYYYYMKTGKMNGNCVMCKQPTSWNQNTGKYNRFCGNPKCKDEYVKIMKSRMVAKYGKTHLLNDPEKQREMLAHRSISGTYTWSDGKHESTYTGSYELDFLKTLDNFFDWDPEDISMPSPHTYTYKYEGEDRFYIPDVFIHSLDLEIEIKDGGDNPNNHHKIQEVDKEKERLKDEVMCSQKAFHYIKITNKNYENFFRFLKEIKKEFEKHEDEKKIPRIFKIEDIKGTNIKPVKESVEIIEEDLRKKGDDFVTDFRDFNRVPYSERDLFFSLRFDLVKDDPEKLKDYLSKLIKASRFEEDIHYVEKMAKKANDYYTLRARRRPETKDEYEKYYDWLKCGGIDKEIKERRKDKLKLIEAYEVVEENLLLSKDNIEVNIDKFGHGNNILYITGLGGSGKSTIIKEYAKRYGAEALEFDAITSALIHGLENLNRNKIHPIILEYLEAQKPNRLNGFSDPAFNTESVKFLDWFEKRVKGDNKLYIIEGMQLFICFEPERFINKPTVIMGTSVSKSMIRSVSRTYKRSEGDIIKTFKFFLKTLKRIPIFVKNDKQINELIDTISECYIEEKFEPDKFLVWFDKPIQKLKGGKIKLYRGSSRIIKNKIEPMSINVGATKYSDPRWSTYFWDNREDAISWALSDTIWDIVGPGNMEYVGHNNKGKNIVVKPDDMDEREFIKYLCDKAEPFYVYEVEVDINDLEIGSCPIIREYTISKPVDIVKMHTYKLNPELCRRFLEIKTKKEYVQYVKANQHLKAGPKFRGPILNNVLDQSRDYYRGIVKTELKNGNIKIGDDLSDYKSSINRHVKNDTLDLQLESYIIDTMEESSISIPQMNYYLQNQYEEEMRNYLNTYKKYYNLMLKEQPSAVEHINEDIRKCLIVIDGMAAKGVENNLVQFAKDDLGEIVKASKHGKPVRVYESINLVDTVNCKLVYTNSNSKQLFSLRDMDSKLIIENSFIVQRDKIGAHCSVNPYYQDNKEENILEFTVQLNNSFNLNEINDKLTEGINILNLHKFDDKEYKFIKESCLRLFGEYPKEIILERMDPEERSNKKADELFEKYKGFIEKHGSINYAGIINGDGIRRGDIHISMYTKDGKKLFAKNFDRNHYPNLHHKLDAMVRKFHNVK